MEEMTRDELSWRWGLLEEDFIVIRKMRGDNNRIGVAADLCSLRCTGAFVEFWDRVPVVATTFLARQLGVTPPNERLQFERRATVSSWRERIRLHLGFQSFGRHEQDALEGSLKARFELDADEGNLMDFARTTLVSWRVLRPGVTTLEGLIRDVVFWTTEKIAKQIVDQMTAKDCALVDGLLASVGQGRPTALDRLKSPDRGAKERAFNSGLDLVEQLAPLLEVTQAVEAIPLAWQRRFCSWIRRNDAWTLRRTATDLRRAMIVCFISHQHRELLDEVVELNHVLVDSLCSNARKAARQSARQAREAVGNHLEVAANALEQLVEASTTSGDVNRVMDGLIQDPGMEALVDAIAACRNLTTHTKDGYTEALLRRYASLRRFEPRFLRLPLEAEPGSEAIVEGVRLVVQLDAQDSRSLPDDAPTEFVPKAWKRWLRDSNGKLRRATWEMALALSLNDALKRGDVFVRGAHHHNSFSEMLFDDDAWAKRREVVLSDLGLEASAPPALDALDHEIAAAAVALSAGLSDNTVVHIHKGVLSVGRDPARQVPRADRTLRRVIHAALPSVRIEQIIVDVDAFTGFGSLLTDALGSSPKLSRFAPLAAVLAEGANLGFSTFASNVEGVTRPELERARRCLTPEALTLANDRVISTIVGHAFDPDQGTIVRTSSDGQRFAVERRSRLTRYYPRQFGFHQRALTMYGHHNLGALFSVGVIACGESEALHVVDALLDPQAFARPNVHHADTHGATLALFGLCHLLDIELQPWLSKPATRRLYGKANGRGPKATEALFHGDVNRPLIAEQWDTMLRVVGSLTERRVSASTALKRMSGSRAGEAFEELGKLVRTRFLLRFFDQKELRKSTRRALNLTESRHKLSRDLYLGNRGRLSGYNLRDLESRASALALLSNCVVAWNTLRLNRIVEDLRADGTPVSDRVLEGVSPFKTSHIQLHGIYRFHPPKATDVTKGA